MMENSDFEGVRFQILDAVGSEILEIVFRLAGNA